MQVMADAFVWTVVIVLIAYAGAIAYCFEHFTTTMRAQSDLIDKILSYVTTDEVGEEE